MVSGGWGDVVVAGRVPGFGRGSGVTHSLQHAAAWVRRRGRLTAGRVAHLPRQLLGQLAESG